jgi:hypothetical protein
MKKLIHTLCFIFFIGVVAVSAQCCKGASADKASSDETASCCSETQKSSEVKAYYFHATRRCATCEAVESVSKEAIQEYYGGKVTFESFNREDEKNEDILAKYKVSGTALLIVKGSKIVNMTNDAFLNARNNPDKFKSKLKSTIDSMI